MAARWFLGSDSSDKNVKIFDKKMKEIIDALVSARNKCAHNDRILISKFGYKNIDMAELINYLKLFMSETELVEFNTALTSIKDRYLSILVSAHDNEFLIYLEEQIYK